MPTNLYSLRPEYGETKYQPTPQHRRHNPWEDKLAILVCQIKIWKPEGTKWFDIPSAGGNCLTIRECESVEVTASAKELVGKAVVRFARGTVISQAKDNKKNVKTGNPEDLTESEGKLEEKTNGGDLTVPGAALYSEDGTSTTSMAANYDDKGLIDFNRTKTEAALLSPNHIAIGNRIEIRLGYAYSEGEFNEMNASDSHTDMPVVFTGFVTSVSVNTPLELECTNMAHVLACVSAPNVNVNTTLTVKDFLDKGGRFDVLKDTGIELDDSCMGSDITISGASITDNLTVADVLTEWAKAGVLCLMDTDRYTGITKLRCGLAYFAGKGGGGLPNTDKKYITYNGGKNLVTILQFDWDVAKDKLSLMRTDKKYLAVEAHGRVGKDKMMKLTVRKNPDSDDDGWDVSADGSFQTVNRRKPTRRKGQKLPEGTYNDRKHKAQKGEKVSLSKYMVITYFSTTANVTEKQLIEEAKQFWASYSPNGISGSIEIFGDVFVKPTDVVGLIDMRQPEKNGYYYVESVNTTFGLNGYRRELKMPYKISKYEGRVETI